jgi:heme-degrading monooxygenase HmoA
MNKMENLDPSTTLASQFEEETGPIILINTFFVPRDVTDEFLVAWRDAALFMKSSPGFIWTQLHQGTANSQLVVNTSAWESTEALARAHAHPKFRETASRFPEGITTYPHIFEKIAVEGVCVV